MYMDELDALSSVERQAAVRKVSARRPQLEMLLARGDCEGVAALLTDDIAWILLGEVWQTVAREGHMALAQWLLTKFPLPVSSSTGAGARARVSAYDQAIVAAAQGNQTEILSQLRALPFWENDEALRKGFGQGVADLKKLPLIITTDNLYHPLRIWGKALVNAAQCGHEALCQSLWEGPPITGQLARQLPALLAIQDLLPVALNWVLRHMDPTTLKADLAPALFHLGNEPLGRGPTARQAHHAIVAQVHTYGDSKKLLTKLAHWQNPLWSEPPYETMVLVARSMSASERWDWAKEAHPPALRTVLDQLRSKERQEVLSNQKSSSAKSRLRG